MAMAKMVVLAKCVACLFFVGGILIGVSHFPKVYDTYFEGERHQAQAVRTKETSRSDHHGNKETPPEGCDISPLANVSLVIHCRNTSYCEAIGSFIIAQQVVPRTVVNTWPFWRK